MDLTYSFMIPLLEFFEKSTHSYGWALVSLTVLVRILMWPLVAKQTKGMMQMQQLAPMMQKLKEQYGDDPELFQKKTMEFYMKNKVNPMSSCLPMLIQLPIFLALFATFSGPPFGDKPIDAYVKVVESANVREVKKETSDGNLPYVGKDGSIAKVAIFPGELKVGKGESIEFGGRAVDGTLPDDFKPSWKIYKDNKPVESGEMAEIDETGHATFKQPGEYKVQAIIHGVAKDSEFFFIHGLGKVATGTNLLKRENWDALGLILFFGVSMYLSMKLSPSASKGPPKTEQERIQQDTMKFMPVVLTGTFFFIPLPVGVLVYMAISNVIQTLQQFILMRRPVPPLIDVTLDDGIIEADTVPSPGNGKPKSLQDGSKKVSVKKKKTRVKPGKDESENQATVSNSSSSTKRRRKKKKRK